MGVIVHLFLNCARLVSPQYGSGNGVGEISVRRVQYFFPIFALSLLRRGSLCRFEGRLPNAQRSQCLSTIITRSSFSIARDHPLFRKFTAVVWLIARSPTLQSLCPWLPQRWDGSTPDRDCLAYTSIKGGTVLRLLPRSSTVNGGSLKISYHENRLSCSLFRSVGVIKGSLANVYRFVFPVFCKILPGGVNCVFCKSGQGFLNATSGYLYVNFRVCCISTSIDRFYRRTVPHVADSVLHPIPTVAFHFRRDYEVSFTFSSRAYRLLRVAICGLPTSGGVPGLVVSDPHASSVWGRIKLRLAGDLDRVGN